MKKIFLSLIICLSVSQIAFSNAKDKLEKVNTISDISSIEMQNKKPLKDNSNKENKSKYLTNYQYDNTHYRYDKIKKYMRSNINYSNMGK